MPSDMSNFGFYTCLCFQWTLFETITSKSPRSYTTCRCQVSTCARAQKNSKRETDQPARHLSNIDQGYVFASSPFTTVLPEEALGS